MTTAILSVIGVVAAALIALLTARLTSTTPAYSALSERIVALEKADAEKSRKIEEQSTKLDELRVAHRDTVRQFTRLADDHGIVVDELGVQASWQKKGSHPPVPVIGAPALALLRKHRAERQANKADLSYDEE